LSSGNSLKGQSKKRYEESIEKVKNGVLQKRMMDERNSTGRLWAHLKHIEMKNTIREIRQ